MRRVLVVVAVVAMAASACIESNLTPCESKLCPVGKSCYAADGEPTCVFPSQLVDCVGRPDGERCTIDETAVASCIGEVCEPVQCGNGIRTADEACDDGNNTNGDGCAADCHSTEVCGNAVLDLAAFEQCDDANTDNFDGCRNDCTLPRCGDGILDPLEECEPQSAVTRTCADFGYYTGTLQCSDTCRFDPVGSCAGRCGDGLVQSQQGEECDGGPPASSCVDLGYDFGAATCTSSCSASSCERFGWSFVRSAAYNAVLSGDQGRLVLVVPHSSVELEDAAGWTSRPGNYVAADRRDSLVLAATPKTVELFDQITWTTLPAPAFPNGEDIRKAILADDLTPTVLACTGTSCVVSQYVAGAWISTPVSSSAFLLASAATGNFVVGTSANTIEWRYPSGSRTEVLPGGIEVLTDSGSAVDVYVYQSNELDHYAFPPVGPGIGPITAMLVYSGGSVGVVGNVAYALDSAPFNVSLRRGIGVSMDVIQGPRSLSGAPVQLFVTHDQHVYASSDEAIYALGPLAPTQRGAANVSGVAYYSALAQARYDSTWLSCQDEVWISTAQGNQKISTSSGVQCRSIWGTSRSDIYVVRDLTTAFGVFHVNHWNGAGWTEELYNAASIDARMIAGDLQPIAVLMTGSLLMKSGSSWTALPPLPNSCAAQAAARLGNVVYAAGACSATTTAEVWKYDGTSWTTLYSAASAAPFVSMAVTADGAIYAATSGGRVVIYDGAMWRAFDSIGTIVAATSASDAFAVLSSNGSRLMRWDGTRWTPVRTDPAMAYRSLVVSKTDVATLGFVFPSPQPVVFSGFMRAP